MLHQFHVLLPKAGNSFEEQCNDLHEQLFHLCEDNGLGLSQLLMARCYFSDVANQRSLLEMHPLGRLLTNSGACSYVEQPPLHPGVKLALNLWFVPAADCRRRTVSVEEGMAVEVEAEGLTYLFHTMRPETYAADALDSKAQTELAFNRHIDLLKRYDMTLSRHCHRTWIYVRDVDCNYQGVVDGRNYIFRREGLTAATHFIASTGIGGAVRNAKTLSAIDFLSVKGLDDGKVGYLHAPEFLNCTVEYGVAFERGTWLNLPSGRLFLISGTASIDAHGNCLHEGDVLTQTGRLFVNIEKLLASAGGRLADMQYMIVYLRDIADYHDVSRYLRLRFPNIPFLITEARVCRPQWLIEVETMAFKPHQSQG